VTAPKGSIKERLSRYREIKLRVTGRKSGKTISIPVWFVLEGDKLYLLPVQGSDTQWYKNVLKNPSIRIDARGVEAEFRATPVSGAKAVKSVVEKFREKYGAGDVKKYYSTFDVASDGAIWHPASHCLCAYGVCHWRGARSRSVSHRWTGNRRRSLCGHGGWRT
jgi:deazaflavin-dependent oxidoreductase (nitroreductase family)